MKEAISLYHRAASKKDFTDYFLILQETLQAELPEPDTWLGQLNYITEVVSFFDFNRQNNWPEFTGAAFQYTQDHNDLEGFLRLADSTER